MSEIVDISDFEYIPISESCLLARGSTQNAILDLKTHKVYGLKEWAGGFLMRFCKLPIVPSVLETFLHKIDRLEQQVQQPAETRNGHRLNIFKPQDLTLPPEHLQHICIEITDVCNLNCIFCSKETWFVGRSIGCRRSPAKDKTTSLDIDYWKKVLNDAHSLGCSSLRLQGGEPLMHPEITLNLLRYAHDLGFGQIQLWTNGILLSPEIVDSLQLLDVDLVIQAFSLQPEIHETITGKKNTFETLMNNLAYVAASWVPFLVAIPGCSTKQTEQDIEHLISFVEDLGRHDARIYRQNVLVQIPLLEKDENGPHSITVNWAGDVFSCSTERLNSLGNVRVTSLREILHRKRPEQKRVETLSHDIFRDNSNIDEDIPTGDQLLLLLARPVLLPEGVKLIQSLDLSDVDWDVFIGQVEHHQVAGIVYHSILTNKLSLPPKVISRLYWDVVRYKRQAHDLLLELEEIARVLNGIDDSVMIFNESLLIKNIYCSLLVRKFEQIDIAIYPDQVANLMARLSQIGYVTEKDMKIKEVKTVEGLESCFSGLQCMRMIKRNTGFVINIYPGLVCHINLSQILKDSQHHATSISGFLMPLLEDQVLLTACVFYYRYRCNDQYIGQLAQAFHQKGFLLYLADVYACVRHYVNQQSLSQLIWRTKNLGLTEELFYALAYVNLFYGKDTIPEEVFHKLHSDGVTNISVATQDLLEVEGVEGFLQMVIKTASSVIQPSLWLLRPWDAYQQVITEVRDWKEAGNPYPNVMCHLAYKVNNGEPSGEDWNRAGCFSITDSKADPKQFFKTHVTSGDKLNEECFYAQVHILWDEDNLYGRVKVSASDITYASSKQFSMYGEHVVIYFSDISDDRLPVKRLGVSVGENGCLEPAPFYPERFMGEATAQDIVFGNFQTRAEISKTHYELYVSVPWRILNITPQKGYKLGFDIEVYHQTMNGGIVSTWAGGQGLSLLNPAVHGIMTLK